MNVNSKLRGHTLGGRLLASMGFKMDGPRPPRAFTHVDQAMLDAAEAKRECRQARNLRLVEAGGFR